MLKQGLLALALVLAGVANAGAAPTFVFSAIPDEDESRLQERFGKVADYLQEELDVDVKYVPVKSYAATITAFRNDQIQLAWFGGLSGVRARELVSGSEAIAQGVADTKFRSYFIAHASTGIKQSEDFPEAIEGKTFTFGSKGSTSGRLMPEYYIRKHFDAPPSEVFARVGFSGDHSRTIALVQSGAYQVGAVNFKVWENEKKAGNINPQRVNIVWTTPTYPDYQWTIRGDVNEVWGEGFKQRVTQALLDMDKKRPELLASFPRKKFIPAKNSDFDAVKATAKDIGLID